MNVYINGSPVSLTQRDYVAEGGEGKVYAKGDIGYKVYHDPKKMLPLGKIRELQAINNPNVIRPLDILTDDKGKAIGYTMRFIREAWALCQVFPKAFRDRNGITHAHIQVMVKELQDLFEAVHAANILIVDANEMNFLLTKDFKVVLAIDADSYQTPHYPATAIMASIRDWKVLNNQWCEGSDWFSFACVTFQMFTGVHPFKGKHPQVDGMEERMKAGISVFDPLVTVPPVAYDFAVIPMPYLDWYQRVFIKGERCAPPSAVGKASGLTVQPILRRGKGLVVITEYGSYDSDVVRFWTNNGRFVVETETTLWVDRRQVGPAPAAVQGLAFSRSGIPVLADVGTGKLRLQDLQAQKQIPFDFAADDVASTAGRLYLRQWDHVYEVAVTETGGLVIASTKVVANVMPHSSRLYPGVIMQKMLGSTFTSILARSGSAYQLRVPDLDKYRVIDAAYDGGVLMVVGEASGKYDRLVFRFDDDFLTYDMRTVSDIQPSGLNFVVLDSGVCACITEDGKLELFSKLKGSNAVKTVDDPAIPGDAVLGKDAGTVLFSQGNKIYTLRMR